MILGISGRSQAGKSTLAKWMKSRGETLWPGQRIYIHGFAYGLKRIAHYECGVPWEYLTGEKKNEVIPGSLHTGRTALLRIGEAFQSVNPSAITDGALRAINPNGFTIFDDVRRVQEVEAIQKRGGKVIRLTRDPERGPTELERELDGFAYFDGVIDNVSLTQEQKEAEAYGLLRSLGVTHARLT